MMEVEERSWFDDTLNGGGGGRIEEKESTLPLASVPNRKQLPMTGMRGTKGEAVREVRGDNNLSLNMINLR